MVTQTKKLVELIPADYNPRKITEAARKGLRSSIETFGNVQPIVWNKTTGHVVSGHQRLSILQEIGETETIVVVVELDPIMEKALNVTMNNKAIEGDFDDDMLSELLQEISTELGDNFMRETTLDALCLPSWEGLSVPEGGNEDFITPRTSQKITIYIPDDKAYLKSEVLEQIERLLRESYDGDGIQVKST